MAAEALVAADVDDGNAWKGAEEGQGAPGFGVRLRASGVVVERDGGLGLGPEIQHIEILDQVFGDVLEGEILAHIHDVVVEEDARRTPHHHLLRLELAEVGDGGLGDGVGRRFVAALVVLDAAAVGRTADGGEIHVQQFEDVHDCAHEMGGAHYVAAEIQHDVGLPDVALGGGQQPVALFGVWIAGRGGRQSRGSSCGRSRGQIVRRSCPSPWSRRAISSDTVPLSARSLRAR